MGNVQLKKLFGKTVEQRQPPYAHHRLCLCYSLCPSRWNFVRHMRKTPRDWLGFYRDQLKLLRPNQVNILLFILNSIIKLKHYLHFNNIFLQFLWDHYPVKAYAAIPEHLRIQSGAWRAFVPLICFDIVYVHLPERILRQHGLVQGIPAPCGIESELHLSTRKGQGMKDQSEINGHHIAHWYHRHKLLPQGAPINADGAPAIADYMSWLLSTTR